MTDTIHTYPLNDLIEHDTESHLCPCDPKVEFINGGTLIIHNSLDRRELYEK
jgi:hypothetical protein